MTVLLFGLFLGKGVCHFTRSGFDSWHVLDKEIVNMDLLAGRHGKWVKV